MPLKVMYLDDELEICEIFSLEFTTKDIQISTWTDYRKAVESAKASPPDVIFMDYRLPGVTGDQVARQMPADIPKYLITGDISVQTEYKFEAIFTKPTNPDKIRAVLNNRASIKQS